MFLRIKVKILKKSALSNYPNPWMFYDILTINVLWESIQGQVKDCWDKIEPLLTS